MTEAPQDLILADGEPFRVVRPASGSGGPLVFASPHSGAGLPPGMGMAPGLSAQTLRSAEDAFVDRLVGTGPERGIPLIAAQVSRIYVDLNRAPDDLDPALIEGAPPNASAKVASGYGVVPRRAGDGVALYDRRMQGAEAAARLARVHVPYHEALADLMRQARSRHGWALLIDWHSMPSRATAPDRGRRGGRAVDIVLGDRHGASARATVTRRVRALLESEGLRVSLNTPYAGGYATQTWGRPDEGFQAVQIEINRALYLDEATLTPSADWSRFKRLLERVVTALSQEPWGRSAVSD